MKVFFGFSSKEITKYHKNYKDIQETIKSLGHSLTRNQLEKALGKAKKKKEEILPLIQPEIISAILASDIVVLDATIRSSEIGFELAYALEKEKPVLFLAQESQEKINKLFSETEESPLLTAKGYNKENLKNIVTDYFSNNGSIRKVRFNLVMDKKQDNYIEWASFTKNKSKTEVIKNAIEHLMKSDDHYKKYLLRD